jgi:hypothetical protein
MIASAVPVIRTTTVLKPDESRVLLRPFDHGGAPRARSIVSRIMSLPEADVGPLVDEIFARFSERHHHLRERCLERFEQVRESIPATQKMSERRRLLIGSYFLAEYSLESAALFNPSIVPDPD